MRKYVARILFMNISVKIVTINCVKQKNVVPRIPEKAYCRSKNPEKFCKGCKLGAVQRECKLQKKKQSGISRGNGLLVVTFLKQWEKRLVLKI